MKKTLTLMETLESLLQIMKCNSIIVAYILIVVAHWSMATVVSITLREKKLVLLLQSKEAMSFFQQNPALNY